MSVDAFCLVARFSNNSNQFAIEYLRFPLFDVSFFYFVFSEGRGGNGKCKQVFEMVVHMWVYSSLSSFNGRRGELDLITY